jgi:xylulokinase
LVSSFLASLFLGKVAPIDISDVCGMNLWDMKEGKWHGSLMELAAGGTDGVEELREVAIDGGNSYGDVSQYFVSRHGFPSDCQIIPFTGDNPATILALPLRASDAMVSLGTSTTFLMSTPSYKPDISYHLMNHPTTTGLHMFMLCYKNGGLAREKVRDEINRDQHVPDNNAWELFNATANASAPLNQANSSDSMKLGLFFPRAEIVPDVPAGHWRFLYDPATEKLVESKSSNDDGSADWKIPQMDARAILESQFLSLRLRSAGLVTSQQKSSSHEAHKDTTENALPPQPRRIYLVGGAALNPAITDICGQVLGGADGVYRLDIGGNACALGAAYKAVWGRERKTGEFFEELIGKRWDEERFVKKVADGYRKSVWETYGMALNGFEQVERRVVEETGKRI